MLFFSTMWMGDNMNTLEIIDVCTKIQDQALIEDISLTLTRGSLTALVGHNGAGKSTLIKTILGMMKKSAGEITVLGKYHIDDHFLEYKQQIAYLPEEPLLFTELTVMQHFQLYGISYNIEENDLQKKVERFVEGFELSDKINEFPESLSKGMRQKVQTICALLPDVPILLIDEPFIGLDIYAMSYLEQLLQEKLERGTSILLTTHQLERIKDLADDYIMLQHGKIIEQGDIQTFETIKRGSEV